MSEVLGSAILEIKPDIDMTDVDAKLAKAEARLAKLALISEADVRRIVREEIRQAARSARRQ